MKNFLLLNILLLIQFLYANDGAFLFKGNQLIPINETDISVKKEILSIKKINNKYIEVSVYYEFLNPKKEKKLTVGFEAFSPEGDADGTPKNGKHPYMRDFTVDFNNSILPFNVSYIKDSLYTKSGKINPIPSKKLDIKEMYPLEYYYVYHFDAIFKKGINVVKHTYNYDLSNSVDYNYFFEYVLTAANRWANKQIDDFTLILDLGEFETFLVDKSFFKNENEWIINGIAKTENVKGKLDTRNENDALKFHLQKGILIFQKKNFKISGELFIYSLNYNGIENPNYIPYSYYQQDKIDTPKTEIQKKILKNLPYARRGYVFKNQELNEFFKKMDWYIPNPNYEPNPEMLTDVEKKSLGEL